ncbi:DnaJ-like protein subfamily C member 17, partial [Stegodyphus mimosarum]
MDDLMKIDLYELLNISINADEKEIKKAYRKKALTCHPDKHPDNPKAAQHFQELSKALEILTDSSARAAYDKLLKARKAAQVRHRELDSKRKKLKEDLEAREKSSQGFRDIDAAQKLQKEIERLRKEGSRQLEKEQEILRQQIEKEKHGLNKSESDSAPRLKVKWKSYKNDEHNDGYDESSLLNIFRKYGYVTCFISKKKKGSAVVEFSTPEAAQMAYESEKGNPENPLSLSWISGQPQEMTRNFHSINPAAAKGP